MNLNETHGPNNGGRIDHDGNELTVDTKVKDPSAVRFGKPFALAAPGDTAIGFLGADLVRSDGKRECVGQFTPRIDDRYPVGHEGTAAAGSWELFVRAPNAGSTDAAMKKVMTVRHDGIEFHVPANVTPASAPSLPNGSVVVDSGHDIRIVQPDGIGWLVFQRDGHLVEYQNAIQWDYNTGIPIWATGKVYDLSLTQMRPRPTPEPPPDDEPSPQPDPVEEQGLRFNYLGQPYVVDAGDFAAMEHIFKVSLDASDEDAYHSGRLSWEGVLKKFQAKVADDNVSV